MLFALSLVFHRADPDVVLFDVWPSEARLQTFTGFAEAPADLGHPEEADALISCRDDSDIVSTQQLAYGKTKTLQSKVAAFLVKSRRSDLHSSVHTFCLLRNCYI